MADKTIEILVKGAGAASGGVAGIAGAIPSAGKGGGLLSGLMGGMGALGSLAGIAGGVTVLVSSSKALMKVLSGFVKMIMMVIKPIGDVVAVLLMPLIWMLMPLVKVMNMLFMPLRKYLMTALSAQKEEFMSLDPTRILSATMTAIGHSFTAWFDTLFSGTTFEQYDKGVGFFNEFINELGETEIEKPKSIIENLWNVLVGSVTAFFAIDIIGGVQGLWNTTYLLVSDFFNLAKELFNIQWFFDLIWLSINNFFNLLIPTETVQSMFDTVNTILHDYFGFEKPAEEDWVQTLLNLVMTQVGIVLAIMSPVTAVMMLASWTAFTDAIIELLDVWIPQHESWKTTISKAINSFWSAIEGAIRYAKNVVKSLLSGGTKSVKEFETEDKISDAVGASVSGYRHTVDDFVLTPTGSLIKTNPADYLFGTKNPEGLTSGGTTINQTITIYAQDAEETKRKLDDLISENMRRYR